MCPDIETYAPLINADFGLGDVVRGAHPAHRLRVRLADRSLIQTNPLLGVASQLLGLAGSRVTASEVLNLAQAAPVRSRFGFTDDDLESITRWVRQANIRWGFDQEHRKPFGVDFVHNTWRFGIDRVLAGVALSDDSHAWIGSTLPLDDVSSNRVELAGKLAEYVDRLQRTADALNGARPLRDWLTALADGIDLLARVDDNDAWQTSQVQREFAEVLATAGPRGDTVMRLPDIRALLGRHLAGRPTRANFRTGTLTVCTMVPMRSVPHRVVCLVGLDDGVFPRLGIVDGDDVLARNPMTGERDIRSEDRQLLLDAIGAATEKLVITYTGANEYSGQDRPPAVPLAELLDTLDMTTTDKVRDRLVVKHPLQPFDIRNVIPGKLGTPDDTPFTFDPTVLRAARASTGERKEQPPFISGPLPPVAADDVVLEDLVAFFKDPVKGFFRALDYTLPWDVDGVEDAMPVDINALEEWTVGDRMLQDMLRGMTPDEARQAEWRRGTLPPGQLGWRKATEIKEQATLLAAAALRHRGPDPQAYDVDIDLGAGRRLTGTVSPVFGDRLVSVTYSKLDGKHLLESWIPLLALIARDSSIDWHAVCIGRAKKGTTPREEGLGRPDVDAVEVLRELVAVYDAGRREPIPLPIKTSYAWAVARHTGDVPEQAARYRWKSSDRYPAEDQAPAHVRAWGHGAYLSDLVDAGLDLVLRAGMAADAARREVGVMDRFDLLGPLPVANSTTVLEASAGTGKTFALAGLVTRYVAEGAATLDQMLLITFGRAASQELRERVRDQIVHALKAFDDTVVDRRQPGGGAPAQGFGRPACDAAPQPAGRVGELRRGDDRDHAPVLPAGAEVAGRGRRQRRRCHIGREPRRLGDRDRRRPIPGPLRAGTRRPSPHLQGCAAAGAGGGEPPVDGAAAARPGVRLPGSGVHRVRERCSGGAGHTQAQARDPRVRRSADPAGRRAGGRRLPCPDSNAPALADRDGRRVPGHRPGAVAGHRPRVQRPLDGDPDRRSEAGDLRVPRRRHRHLSEGRGDGGRQADSRHQLAQRRRARRPAAGGVARRRTRRPAHRRARRRRLPPWQPARGCAELRSVPAAGGQAGDVRPPRNSEPRHRRPAHAHRQRTSPRTSERCWPATPRSTARSWWPAT